MEIIKYDGNSALKIFWMVIKKKKDSVIDEIESELKKRLQYLYVDAKSQNVIDIIKNQNQKDRDDYPTYYYFITNFYDTNLSDVKNIIGVMYLSDSIIITPPQQAIEDKIKLRATITKEKCTENSKLDILNEIELTILNFYESAGPLEFSYDYHGFMIECMKKKMITPIKDENEEKKDDLTVESDEEKVLNCIFYDKVESARYYDIDKQLFSCYKSNLHLFKDNVEELALLWDIFDKSKYNSQPTNDVKVTQKNIQLTPVKGIFYRAFNIDKKLEGLLANNSFVHIKNSQLIEASSFNKAYKALNKYHCNALAEIDICGNKNDTEIAYKYGYYIGVMGTILINIGTDFMVTNSLKVTNDKNFSYFKLQLSYDFNNMYRYFFKLHSMRFKSEINTAIDKNETLSQIQILKNYHMAKESLSNKIKLCSICGQNIHQTVTSMPTDYYLRKVMSKSITQAICQECILKMRFKTYCTQQWNQIYLNVIEPMYFYSNNTAPITYNNKKPFLAFYISQVTSVVREKMMKSKSCFNCRSSVIYGPIWFCSTCDGKSYCDSCFFDSITNKGYIECVKAMHCIIRIPVKNSIQKVREWDLAQSLISHNIKKMMKTYDTYDDALYTYALNYFKAPIKVGEVDTSDLLNVDNWKDKDSSGLNKCYLILGLTQMLCQQKKLEMANEFLDKNRDFFMKLYFDMDSDLCVYYEYRSHFEELYDCMKDVDPIDYFLKLKVLKLSPSLLTKYYISIGSFSFLNNLNIEKNYEFHYLMNDYFAKSKIDIKICWIEINALLQNKNAKPLYARKSQYKNTAVMFGLFIGHAQKNQEFLNYIQIITKIFEQELTQKKENNIINNILNDGLRELSPLACSIEAIKEQIEKNQNTSMVIDNMLKVETPAPQETKASAKAESTVQVKPIYEKERKFLMPHYIYVVIMEEWYNKKAEICMKLKQYAIAQHYFWKSILLSETINLSKSERSNVNVLKIAKCYEKLKMHIYAHALIKYSKRIERKMHGRSINLLQAIKYREIYSYYKIKDYAKCIQSYNKISSSISNYRIRLTNKLRLHFAALFSHAYLLKFEYCFPIINEIKIISEKSATFKHNLINAKLNINLSRFYLKKGEIGWAKLHCDNAFSYIKKTNCKMLQKASLCLMEIYSNTSLKFNVFNILSSNEKALQAEKINKEKIVPNSLEADIDTLFKKFGRENQTQVVADIVSKYNLSDGPQKAKVMKQVLEKVQKWYNADLDFKSKSEECEINDIISEITERYDKQIKELSFEKINEYIVTIKDKNKSLLTNKIEEENNIIEGYIEIENSATIIEKEFNVVRGKFIESLKIIATDKNCQQNSDIKFNKQKSRTANELSLYQTQWKKIADNLKELKIKERLQSISNDIKDSMKLIKSKLIIKNDIYKILASIFENTRNLKVQNKDKEKNDEPQSFLDTLMEFHNAHKGIISVFIAIFTIIKQQLDSIDQKVCTIKNIKYVDKPEIINSNSLLQNEDVLTDAMEVLYKIVIKILNKTEVLEIPCNLRRLCKDLKRLHNNLLSLKPMIFASKDQEFEFNEDLINKLPNEKNYLEDPCVISKLEKLYHDGCYPILLRNHIKEMLALFKKKYHSSRSKFWVLDLKYYFTLLNKKVKAKNIIPEESTDSQMQDNITVLNEEYIRNHFYLTFSLCKHIELKSNNIRHENKIARWFIKKLNLISSINLNDRQLAQAENYEAIKELFRLCESSLSQIRDYGYFKNDIYDFENVFRNKIGRLHAILGDQLKITEQQDSIKKLVESYIVYNKAYFLYVKEKYSVYAIPILIMQMQNFLKIIEEMQQRIQEEMYKGSFQPESPVKPTTSSKEIDLSRPNTSPEIERVQALLPKIYKCYHKSPMQRIKLQQINLKLSSLINMQNDDSMKIKFIDKLITIYMKYGDFLFVIQILHACEFKSLLGIFGLVYDVSDIYKIASKHKPTDSEISLLSNIEGFNVNYNDLNNIRTIYSSTEIPLNLYILLGLLNIDAKAINKIGSLNADMIHYHIADTSDKAIVEVARSISNRFFSDIYFCGDLLTSLNKEPGQMGNNFLSMEELCTELYREGYYDSCLHLMKKQFTRNLISMEKNSFEYILSLQNIKYCLIKKNLQNYFDVVPAEPKQIKQVEAKANLLIDYQLKISKVSITNTKLKVIIDAHNHGIKIQEAMSMFPERCYAPILQSMNVLYTLNCINDFASIANLIDHQNAIIYKYQSLARLLSSIEIMPYIKYRVILHNNFSSFLLSIIKSSPNTMFSNPQAYEQPLAHLYKAKSILKQIAKVKAEDPYPYASFTNEMATIVCNIVEVLNLKKKCYTPLNYKQADIENYNKIISNLIIFELIDALRSLNNLGRQSSKPFIQIFQTYAKYLLILNPMDKYKESITKVEFKLLRDKLELLQLAKNYCYCINKKNETISKASIIANYYYNYSLCALNKQLKAK